jgi:hypothetical protein
VAINFVTNDDERLLQDIQRFYNTVIEVGAGAAPPTECLPAASLHVVQAGAPPRAK